MPWARLDDGFYAHPKVLKLDKDLPALTLWVLGLSYCAQQKTDGFLTRPAATRLVGPDHVDNWAAALVRVKLWRRARGGWRYHDYTDYNFDRKTIAKHVADNRARQQRFRGSHASRNALVTPLLTPIPSLDSLDPSQKEEGLGSSTRSDGPPRIPKIAVATRPGKEASNGHLPPELVAKLHAAHPDKSPAQIIALFAGTEATA